MYKQRNFILHHSLFLVLYSLFFSSCSTQKQIHRSASKLVLKTDVLKMAHVGISVYDPAEGKYLYNYNGDKYFVPASNVKIPTCYAAMKYLGDSLVGLRYDTSGYCITIQGTGDPTFLQPEYVNQPVFHFLNKQVKNLCYTELSYTAAEWGNGWSWNDYDQSYMAPRSPLPAYGNLVRFQKDTLARIAKDSADSIPSFNIRITPGYFKNAVQKGNVRWKYAKGFAVERSFSDNSFFIIPDEHTTDTEVPFTNTRTVITDLLADTLKKTVLPFGTVKKKLSGIIYSQPTDAVLRPMMHRSDNFYAEQFLLMVSNEYMGVMNDAQIIDTLLKTDFRDLPQKPRWVDGSGLSRYNLFTPQDLVTILGKMKNEFGMDRIKDIFATGGQGTISNYYKTDSGFIYAKTGTLSGVVALSGFLYTKKGRLLLFSTLVNNHNGSATAVRRAVEQFIRRLREQ
jgi:serine-type D-Ala-D-Ala carboxypeptidase/endopeptidase (penicillin-binding protein 4)